MDERLVVFHRREGVVEVMEKASPLLILRRAAKTLSVVFQPVPLHQEQIARWTFQAPVQTQRYEPRHGGDDVLCLCERLLEAPLLTLSDIETGVFENHVPILPRVAARRRSPAHGRPAGAEVL